MLASYSTGGNQIFLPVQLSSGSFCEHSITQVDDQANHPSLDRVIFITRRWHILEHVRLSRHLTVRGDCLKLSKCQRSLTSLLGFSGSGNLPKIGIPMQEEDSIQVIGRFDP